MSKRTRPTTQSIKQGQTIYMINYHIEKGFDEEVTVDKYFLYSHKTTLPPIGCAFDKLPVSRVRDYIKKFGNMDLFYSIKKAESFANLINK
jgi:hypothetical protein